MNVLLIGGGGREHALAWKLRQSPAVERLYSAPGNAGLLQVAEIVPLAADDPGQLISFCKSKGIGLVVIGPEGPLRAGITDRLGDAGILVFGPSQAAARLEASKSFTKSICDEHGIPTAAYGHFNTAGSAKAYVRAQHFPLVVKADGLAAGKGVTICETKAEADRAIDDCFAGAFGDSGSSVVIEEMLIGEEASFFAIADGTRATALASAQDYKRAYDDDTGPNTGGMGAVSPAPMMSAPLASRVMAEIIEPTLAAMRSRGTPFRGVLYAGLMITDEGPKLIEFNVRFGDPECQVLMLRLQSDLLPVLIGAATGELPSEALEWSDNAAITVVMAAKGYPGHYERGTPISNLAAAESVAGVTVFHAGTALGARGEVLARGGRVLNIAAVGASVSDARSKAYRAAGLVDWDGGYYRRDIGWRSVSREAKR